MEDLFELMTAKEGGEGKVSVRLGIRLKVAGQETVCPVLRSCDDYKAFEREMLALMDRLQQIQQKAKALFNSPSAAAGLSIGLDTPAEAIWDALSAIADEAQWVASFNELSEAQRQAVADHVLTHCNIFSGKAAIFSRRYDSETGLM